LARPTHLDDDRGITEGILRQNSQTSLKGASAICHRSDGAVFTFRDQQRGNKYLRKMLIHGGRAALPHLAQKDTPLGRWAKGLLARAHKNVVAVALANKLARLPGRCCAGERSSP
jgi:transposase